MRSSASTRNRSPEFALELYLVFAGEDRPRPCTGRRLLRAGAVRGLGEEGSWPEGAVVLDPFSPEPLSPADRSNGRSRLVGVDCSWNQLSARGTYPRTARRLNRLRARRRLPWLLAGNAQHYGHLGQLNTAEALAAAAYILGEVEQARYLLSASGVGVSLLELNREPLESYRQAKGRSGILDAEREFF